MQRGLLACRFLRGLAAEEVRFSGAGWTFESLLSFWLHHSCFIPLVFLRNLFPYIPPPSSIPPRSTPCLVVPHLLYHVGSAA